MSSWQRIIKGLAYRSMTELHARPSGAFSHRQPRIPEPLKKLLLASGIGDRHLSEKIYPPFPHIVAGILSHFLTLKRHESLHGITRRVNLAEVPERCCPKGQSCLKCPGNARETAGRVSKVAFEIGTKCDRAKTGLRL